MEGILELRNSQMVGKIKEYPTKKEFADAIEVTMGLKIDIIDIETAYMRYFPKGTEDSADDFGEGVGIYQVVEKYSRGAFKVWMV